MPLVPDGGRPEPARTPAHAEARKIDPRYAKGELRRVAVGRNLAEAELIKGMLLEQGIPSMLRRTGGFDVPDFLAAGPRDVLVPESGAGTARELLADADARGDAGAPQMGADPALGAAPAGSLRSWQLRLAAALLAALLALGAAAGGLWVLAR
jgi:hypothetical protein